MTAQYIGPSSNKLQRDSKSSLMLHFDTIPLRVEKRLYNPI